MKSLIRRIRLYYNLFQSYHEFANYLCREVFTDMSVLPLVFPSNISCFSSGSYKVELSNLVIWI